MHKKEPTGEPNKSLNASADPAPATTFHLITSWRSAVEVWRGHLYVDGDAKKSPLLLRLRRTPTEADETPGAEFYVDAARAKGEDDPAEAPVPSDMVLEALRTHPGLAAFREAAGALATAIQAVRPVLVRHGLETHHADVLLATLRGCPGLPSLADYRASWVVQRQLEGVDARIWQGVLPPDEDMRERRAFWEHELSSIRTRDGHERLAAAVGTIMSSPRSPEHELALLNHFLAEHHREDLQLVLDPIRMAEGTDWLSVCRRWQDLVAFGLRFFAHQGQTPGQQVISLDDIVLGRVVYPEKGDVPPIALEWAQRLRDTTESLRPCSEAAGFAAGERVPISKMVQDLDSILAGKAVDIGASVAGVRVLVDEIVAQARRSRRSILDRFHQVVLNLRSGIVRLLKLVSTQHTGHDLMVLDHYVGSGTPDDRAPGPGRADDIEWRSVTTSLLGALSEATDLWSVEREDPAASLRRDFAPVGKSQAKVAVVHESTHHELVMTVARIILDPETAGSVPRYAIDAVGPGPTGKPCPGIVRRRVVEALKSGPWSRADDLDLEREYVEAGALLQGPPTAPSQAELPALKFPRAQDAKRKCLEALASAPDGIPRHEDTASVTGLAYDTVKEVMTTLKKARYVEKTNGAWRITASGLDYLELLRAE